MWKRSCFPQDCCLVNLMEQGFKSFIPNAQFVIVFVLNKHSQDSLPASVNWPLVIDVNQENGQWAVVAVFGFSLFALQQDGF